MRSGSKRTAGLVLAVVTILVSALPMRAGSPFATETGHTSVPYGWVDFCNRYTGECDGPDLPARDVQITPATMKVLESVNAEVNASIQSVTDMDHWGVIDKWDYPFDGKGDCEDYALMKRKILLDKGLPRQALLMTVVKDHAGEGHAVLTVKTNRADYVLDNMSDRVVRWDETGYRFVKRQSQTDQNLWVALNAPEDSPQFTAR